MPSSESGGVTLHYHFMMIGVGMLLSWNAICTAFDWINSEFPDMDASFYFTVCNFVPSLLFQPLTVKFGRLLSFNVRIIIPFLVMGLLLVVTPLVVQFSTKNTGFALMCIVSTVIGTFNAVAQTSVFGLAGMMPNSYTNAVMVGNGAAGVLINIVRIVCLAAFMDRDNGLLLSTIVYFAVSGVVLVFCLASQWLLMRHALVVQCTRAANTSSMLSDKLDLQDGESDEAPAFSVVWRDIWQYAVLVFTCYLVTFGMFPTVCISTTGQSMSYAWFAVLMFLVFNLFDILGRNAPAFFLVRARTLTALVLGRFVFWVTFLLVATSQPPAWLFGGSATWFKFLNMAVFAFSNGYTSTCCMILGPAQVKPTAKDRAGSIMSTALAWGIIAGSLLALSFETTAHPPKD